MEMLKITLDHGDSCYVSRADWDKCQHIVPTRCSTGTRHADLPRGLRPRCTSVLKTNARKVEVVP
jgi:hypothetical protein